MIVGFEWDFDREEPPIGSLATPFAKGSVVRAVVLVPPLGHSVIRSSAASLRNKKFDSFRGEQGMWCQLSTDCFFSLVETMCLGLGLYYSKVQCTIYSVQWTVYSVQCKMYRVQWSVYSRVFHFTPHGCLQLLPPVFAVSMWNWHCDNNWFYSS